MSDTTNQTFKIVAKITGYTLRKSADGAEKYVLSGMASNTNIDLTGERMAETALNAMVKSLETNKVTINNEHGSDWDDDFGEVTRLWVTDSHELMMEAELDPDHYRTKTLIKALDKGKQLGLSIGGIVKSAALEWFEDLGRKVMTYKDISLFHVAITGTPAVADTWVSPITKSVKDWKELSMLQDETKLQKNEEVASEEVVEEVAILDEQPAEAVAEEQPTQEVVDEQPTQAPEQDTTEKSEGEGEQAEPVQDNQEDATPAEPEAPAQEEEAQDVANPDADAAPETAEVDTSEVEKSAVFDAWTTADITEQALNSLFYEAGWQVWLAMASSSKPEAERLEAIRATLAEFSEVALRVAQALMQSESPEDLAKAVDAYQAQSQDSVSKSLTAKDDELTQVNKALTQATTELEEAKESLDEATTKSSELETELAKLNGRKTLAFNEGARKAVIVDDKALNATPAEATKSVLETWFKHEGLITTQKGNA